MGASIGKAYYVQFTILIKIFFKNLNFLKIKINPSNVSDLFPLQDFVNVLHQSPTSQIWYTSGM